MKSLCPRSVFGTRWESPCPKCGAGENRACRLNVVKVETTEATAAIFGHGAAVITPTPDPAEARFQELIAANNREVEFRRDGFRAAVAVLAYLDNLLKHPLLRDRTSDNADPAGRHPFAKFELDHIERVGAFVRDPYKTPNPFKESKP